MKRLQPLRYAATSCLLLMMMATADTSITVNVAHLCDLRASAMENSSPKTESSSRPPNADAPSASLTEIITVHKPWMRFMYASRIDVRQSSSETFLPSKPFQPFVLQSSPRPSLQSTLEPFTQSSSKPIMGLSSQSTLQFLSSQSTLQFLFSKSTSKPSFQSSLQSSSQSTSKPSMPFTSQPPTQSTLLFPSSKSTVQPFLSSTSRPSSQSSSQFFTESTSQPTTSQISSQLASKYSSQHPLQSPTTEGPVALKQVRFPSAKYGENVKLDQQASRPDFSTTAVGPFGFGLVVSDAGLRFIGVAEAAVMWQSMPAKLVLDLIGNAYEWDAVAKKILPYEWPLIVVCALMIASGLILARYGVYWQRRYKEAKWLGDTGWESGCKKGVLVVAVQMLLLMLGAGACGLLVTNETTGSAVSSVGDLFEFGVGDLVDMFSVTQKQIRTITVGSMDSTTDAIFSKLDDIAEQLGGPIENDIYGPSHRFGSRINVTRVVQDFQKIFPKAKDVMSQAELVKDDIIMYNKKIIELNMELQMVPERCPLEVSEMCKMISDNKLKAENYTYLDDLINSIRGVLAVENDGLSSLPLTSAESANIPKALYEQTEKERWRVKQTLMDRRRQLEFSIYPYESHTRKIVSKLMDMKELANDYMVHLKRMETYRWSVSVGIAIGALLVWILLACSIVVNYCSHATWAKCYFFGCVSAMRLTSIALWLAALVGLCVSGNGEANVCRPLYDEPAYETVTKIMDSPTVTSERGFFSWFVLGNDTSPAPFNEVIESCKANRTAYSTFNLNKVFDVDVSSDYSKWPGVMDALDGLKTRRVRVELDVNSRPQSTADALKPISESTNLDFQKFRNLILTSSLDHGRVTLLRDQLNALLTQTTTFSNAFKFTLKHVVANISDLIESVMSPMGQKKNMLLYHLTLMEVEMEPLSESLNRTWANAYTRIENSDFDQILRKNMAQYTNSIKSLLDKYKSHVSDAVKTEATSCRPVWNIYRIGRDLVCRQALDSLNGFWVICFFIAMSITAAIPVVKNLKIFHKSPLTSMSLYTIPPPPAMELMCTNS